MITEALSSKDLASVEIVLGTGEEGRKKQKARPDPATCAGFGLHARWSVGDV